MLYTTFFLVIFLMLRGDVKLFVMFRWLTMVGNPKNSAILALVPPIGIVRYFHTTRPSTSKRTHYEILGVKPTASTTEIRDAFVKLSKIYHPDVNKSEKQSHERFVEINEAYSILSKSASRREYDAKLRQGWRPESSTSQHYYDPNRERYRQYYEELNRMRRPPPGFSKYAGPPPDDPFRDFWTDFNRSFEQRGQQSTGEPGGRRVKMDENANKAFYVFMLAVFSVSIVVHLFQYLLIRQNQTGTYRGDIDESLARWGKVVVVDRPDEDHKPQPGYSTPSRNHNGRFYEA